jgi:FkbM family methyltransferase
MQLGNLLRPYYLYRPTQAARRLLTAFRKPGASEVVTLPWGSALEVNPHEVIGHTVLHAGIWDLAVSEALWRLLRPGDVAIDVGANIGHMTTLMATRVAPRGRVFAFEPHPVVGQRLDANVARLRRGTAAPVQVLHVALSESEGEVFLDGGSAFGSNQGLAHVVDGASSATAIRVPTRRLDDVLRGEQVRVAKIDVEGHEPQVLAGATTLLRQRAIEHIVYEAQDGAASPVHDMLEGYGFTVFSLGWSTRGPRLGARHEHVAHAGETPDFLAALDAASVRAAFAARGWRALRGRATAP